MADAGIALCIGCGGLIDLALERAGSRGIAVVRCASTQEAALAAKKLLLPGDAVLIKGSRSTGTERVIVALE